MNSRKKIKICHVTSAHHRYDVRIFLKECKSLSRNGYDVYLIVNDTKENEEIDEVKIRSTKFQPKNKLQRFFTSKKYIKKLMLSIDADAYHFHDPELLQDALWIKKHGKHVIFDFHEDFSNLFVSRSWIPKLLKPIVSKMYKQYESACVKKYDALVSVTPQIIDKLSSVNNNTIMITNYPILDSSHLVTTTSMIPTKICFAGGIHSQWNHLKIIQAIDEIEGIEYHIAGPISDDYLSAIKESTAWSKVKYYGVLNFEEVKRLYSSSSIGMAVLSNNTQVGKEGTYGNTKLFEYMEAGLPIICTNNKIWTEIVEKYNCGVLVNPENTDEIRNAIEFLINNPIKAKTMGTNGMRAIKNEYNWATQEIKLVQLYDNLFAPIKR